MKRRIGLLAALLLTGLALASVPAAADNVIGNPDIELSAPDNHLDPGQRTTLQVYVTNSGELDAGGPSEFETRVQTARNVRFTMQDDRIDAPIDVRTGTIVRDSVPPGGLTNPIEFTIDVGDSIEPGSYRIPVRVEYDYTSRVEHGTNQRTQFIDFSRQRTEYVTIVVEEDARFRITGEQSQDVYAGDTGMLRFGLRNAGSVTARNARVTLTSPNSAIFFGGSTNPQSTTTVFVPAVEPGQSRSVTVQFGAKGDTVPGSYPVNAEVTYSDPNGIQRTSNTLHLGVTVEGSSRFAVNDVESDLRVGSDGVLRGLIRNRGSTPVQNAVVLFENDVNSNVNAVETEYAVGDLEPNESKQFNFRLEVSDQAEGGARLLTLRTRYRNFNDDIRQSDSLDVPVEIGRERKTFLTRAPNASVEAGSSSTFEVSITNNVDQTLTNIQARMFTDSPLSSGDDEAFIPSLEPGETETVVMSLAAGGSATPRTYSVSFDFSYEDQNNDTKVTDRYLLPVEVTPSSGGGLPVLPIIVVLAVGAGAVWWWRNRDR